MKVTIITVAYNSANTIRDTLESVANQTYSDIEHIIIDGASTDSTLKIISEFPHVTQLISEPDEGIYDAMNKGIGLATGQIIGILNADDFFPNDKIIDTIVHSFDQNTDAVLGDVAFVNPKNVKKLVRYYSSANWHPGKFKRGYMPPHPSVYLKSEVYQKYGVYKTDYQIASDYELLIRMLYKHKIKYKYIAEQIVTMRTGGVSTKDISSRYIINKEIVRGCKENGISTNMIILIFKYFKKVFEYYTPEKKQKN